MLEYADKNFIKFKIDDEFEAFGTWKIYTEKRQEYVSKSYGIISYKNKNLTLEIVEPDEEFVLIKDNLDTANFIAKGIVFTNYEVVLKNCNIVNVEEKINTELGNNYYYTFRAEYGYINNYKDDGNNFSAAKLLSNNLEKYFPHIIDRKLIYYNEESKFYSKKESEIDPNLMIKVTYKKTANKIDIAKYKFEENIIHIYMDEEINTATLEEKVRFIVEAGRALSRKDWNKNIHYFSVICSVAFGGRIFPQQIVLLGKKQMSNIFPAVPSYLSESKNYKVGINLKYNQLNKNLGVSIEKYIKLPESAQSLINNYLQSIDKQIPITTKLILLVQGIEAYTYSCYFPNKKKNSVSLKKKINLIFEKLKLNDSNLKECLSNLEISSCNDWIQNLINYRVNITHGTDKPTFKTQNIKIRSVFIFQTICQAFIIKELGISTDYKDNLFRELKRISSIDILQLEKLDQ